MKHFFLKSAVIGGFVFLIVAFPAIGQVNVTQHHNHASRDGLYVDPALTSSAAAALTRDLNFDGTIVGNVYAQPLYIEGGPDGKAKVIAVTASNNVYALDARNGTVIWQRNAGTAITSGLPCGNINPLGIIGTPVVDLASRSLFFDAEVSGIGHRLFSVDVDTGVDKAGWPINLNSAVSGFDSSTQSERAALAILGTKVYVPYGGRFGDCPNSMGVYYRGRVVGVEMNNPASLVSYATTANRSGIWGPGGIAHDGTNLFVTTGNGPGGATWNGSEAVIRLQTGPVFSGNTADYWAPTNWASLDSGDTDLGGSGPIVLDVPGATPSALVLALGKDGIAYLLNRAALGGVGAPVASTSVSTGSIIQTAAVYRTTLATYFVFRHSSTQLRAYKINATAPPTMTSAWTVTQAGRGSPFVTSTDGTTNAIVWAEGSDNRLRGYNGDTGAAVFAGGGASELMAGARGYNCNAIAARGRIYVANDSKVYAFTVPVPPIVLNSVNFQTGAFQLFFNNTPGLSFTVFSSTNLATPFANWTRLGTATEVASGQFEFDDPSANALTQNFYRVTSP